jgi:hypothetical protein
MSIFMDLLGSTKSYFKLGIAGVRLTNNSGNLDVKNSAGNADAAITASAVNVSGETLTLNSDAAESAADWKITLSRPASGMTANVALTLPIDDGTSGQVLGTDGSGVLSWVSASSTSLCDKVDTTTLAFGSAATLALFSTGAADVINKIQIVVDTPFNGTAPTVSIGVAGTVSKYSAVTDVDLKTAGVYEINPGIPAAGIEALIATYAADSSSAGSARILIFYATPA